MMINLILEIKTSHWQKWFYFISLVMFHPTDDGDLNLLSDQSYVSDMPAGLNICRQNKSYYVEADWMWCSHPQEAENSQEKGCKAHFGNCMSPRVENQINVAGILNLFYFNLSHFFFVLSLHISE